MIAVRARQILLIDWRGDGLPKEANKLRPCVVVEDDAIFDESYESVIVVPLTTNESLAMPGLRVTIDPTSDNGCTVRSYAVAHAVTTASKRRVARVTDSFITEEQLSEIRARIAESLGIL